MKKNKKGTRVHRYSKKNKLIRNLKKLGFKGVLKKLLNAFIRDTIYLVVGFVYASYLLIKSFDNLVVKLFLKFPRVIRVVIIYSLVINLGLDIYNISIPLGEYINTYKIEETTNAVASSQPKPQNTPTLEKTAQIQTKPIEEGKCTLEHETACKIKNKAEEYNIDWKIAVSISAWETGYWKSNLYHTKNNVGGLYCNGSFLKYNTLDEGIEAYVSNLKRLYFDMGLDTLEEIQKKYCPIGAKNDPNGLNKNWLGGVTKIYNSLEK